jgi:SSS family solute:Na+ symporter
VVVGCGLATLFVTDQLIGSAQGTKLFPWLHTKLTLNYSYRGLWGSIACVTVMFAVSSFTKKTDPAALEKLTISWKMEKEGFRGIRDWRLQLAVLTALTILIYWILW